MMLSMFLNCWTGEEDRVMAEAILYALCIFVGIYGAHRLELWLQSRKRQKPGRITATEPPKTFWPGVDKWGWLDDWPEHWRREQEDGKHDEKT